MVIPLTQVTQVFSVRKLEFESAHNLTVNAFSSPSSNEVQRGQEKILLCSTFSNSLRTSKTGDTAVLISSLAAPPSLPTSSAFLQNTITIQGKEFAVKSNETDKSPSQNHKAEVKQGTGMCRCS